ncbi:MAG: ABC-F family ATP-binding cassette domain-containing protein, partial [Phycisphaerae bacterium]
VQRGGAVRVGYLPQDAPAPAEKTLWQSMLDVFADVRGMEAELAEMAGQLHDDTDGQRLRRYGQLQSRFEAAGGYDHENRARTVLTGLGFAPAQHGTPLAHLSGGQRTRGLLARLLLEEPNVLLLDEPTNHLDLDALEWLERFLTGYRHSLVVVSHDRYFLDRITGRTWEISFGHLDVYRGGYTAYVQKRDERFDERVREWQAQQAHIAKTEDFIRRNISGQRGKEARGRRTRLERFLATKAMAKPQRHRRLAVRIAPLHRSGDLVLRAKELVIGHAPGHELMEVGDLEVRRGQRIAVVGPNGVGKTTLLRTLLGEIAPLNGAVRLGTNVSMGHLPQTHDNLRGEATVLQSLLDAVEGLKPEPARTLLGGLLFRGDEVLKRIDELSGGQRSRVVLAQLAATAPNVLMLDEPTNHLDLPSREVVQDMLLQFPGTVIFVSHDRYLIEALATHVWALEEKVIHRLTGGWEHYLRWRAEYHGGVLEASPPGAQRRREGRRAHLEARRRSRGRQRLERRLAEVEDAVDAVERRLAALTDEAGEAGEAGDMGRIREIGERHEQASAELRDLWSEYERLGEQIEQEPPAGRCEENRP